MPEVQITVPDININLDIYCSCGNGLCSQSSLSYSRGGYQVTIDPCEKCLERAEHEGYIKGCNDTEK